MFTNSEIQKRFKDVGLPRLIPAYMQASVATDSDVDEFNSGIACLLDYYLQDRLERQFESNVAKAGLPYVGITVNDVELQYFPHLKWYRLEQIRSGTWVKTGRSVLIHGNVSDAQLRLGSAIVSELMLQGMTLRCCSLKDLTCQLLKAQTQQEAKKSIAALKRLDVLFIYDFEPIQLTHMECYWLSNLLEARKVTGGLLISSISTPVEWCEQLDDIGLTHCIQSVIEPELIRLELISKGVNHE